VSVGIVVSFTIFTVVPQFPTESPMEITDGIVSSVFHRELEKNYGLVPQFPTESPTELPCLLQTEYSVGNLVAGIIFFGALIRLYFRRNVRRYFFYYRQKW